MPALAIACLVVAIADGDTLTARCDGEAAPYTVIVRLAEIDAPEKRQAFGAVSKQHLADLCFQKPVELVGSTRDRYGRTVARALCDGIDANAAQVRAGMAWAFTQYLTDRSIADIERDARKQRLGLWSDPVPVPPWEWRKAGGTTCDGPPPWPSRCQHTRAAEVPSP